MCLLDIDQYGGKKKRKKTNSSKMEGNTTWRKAPNVASEATHRKGRCVGKKENQNKHPSERMKERKKE